MAYMPRKQLMPGEKDEKGSDEFDSLDDEMIKRAPIINLEYNYDPDTELDELTKSLSTRNSMRCLVIRSVGLMPRRRGASSVGGLYGNSSGTITLGRTTCTTLL